MAQFNYKGDKACYAAKHLWMVSKFGNPSYCEDCGLVGIKVGRRWNLEWANISGLYKRERLDWIPLCKKCHRRFDLKNGMRQNTAKLDFKTAEIIRGERKFLSAKELADKYKVTERNIYDLLKNKIWKKETWKK